jgi:DNA polymerase-3 subunit gamma/tau
MLSKSAFNALLKTLEEPPNYVKFIFATTEIKKVPITILSRCQKFNLRRLSFDETKGHIKNISEKENFEIEEGALNILSNFAEGSVRDALSLLDRALGYNEYKKILTEQAVSEMLGLSGKKAIYDLLDTILEGKTDNALRQFENIYTNNVDANSLLQDLLEAIYNVILAKNLKNFFEITKLPTDQLDMIKNLREKTTLHSQMRVWKMLLQGEKELKSDFDSKKIMEILIVNICFGSRLPAITDILNGEVKQEKNNEITSSIMDMFDGAKIL